MADGIDYDAAYRTAGWLSGVDPALLKAQAVVESGQNPSAVSPAGAQGVMQVMPQNDAALGITDPTNPTQSIDGGAKLMAQNLGQYGDVASAVAAYHGGSDKANWGPKTRAYVQSVMSHYDATPDAFSAAFGNVAPSRGETGSSESKASDAFERDFGAPSDGPSPIVPHVPQGAAPGSPAIDSPTGVIYSDNTPVTSDKMAKVWKAFTSSKAYDPKADPGTPGKPYAQAHGIAPVPGATYLGEDGKLYTPTQADLDAYQAAAKQEQLGDAGGATFNGFTQGFAPEVVGAARYIASGGNPSAYSQGANVAQAQLDAYKAAHPGVAALSTGAGSLASGAVGLEGASAALGAARVPALLGPTGEFLAGSAGGNNLLGYASRAANAGVQGAALGAGSSQLNPDVPVLQQAALGGAIGGGIGAVAPAILGTGRALGRLGEPFSATGRDAIANRLINTVADADIAPGDLDVRPLVPGSSPTLAQATGNPGIGALERAVRATPQGAVAFGARDAANTSARNALLDTLTGDDVTLDTLKGARDAATSSARDAAFANAQPTDASGVVSKIDEIMASPAGQRDAVSNVLGDIRSKLVKPIAGTNVAEIESDPAQLYGIRQALTDHLATQGPKTASDARLATNELMQVKGALDDAIETGAPGYKDYLKQFSDASGPIDEQQLLQSMKLHDMRGNVTLGKVDQAINRITQGRAANGANSAKSVSDDTLNALMDLREDLRREQTGSAPGKFIGSNTVQNLATNQVMGRMGVPEALGISLAPHGPVAGAALGLGKLALASKNGAVQEALINRLLNPSGFAGAGQGASGIGSQQWLANTLTRSLVPPAVEGSRNYLMSGATQ